MKRALTLMFVPEHNGSKVRVIHLPAFFVPALVFVCTLWIVVFVFFMWGYHRRVIETSNYDRLAQENALLVDRTEWLNSHVDSLRQEIDFLVQQDKMLRLLADLPEIDEETRSVGIGGAALPFEEFAFDSMNLSGFPPSIEVDVDQLLREAALLKASYYEIENTFIDQKDLLDHTPTIMPTAGWFSSYFGKRRDPFTGNRQLHRGVDIANRKGTPIYATADGTVKHFGFDKSLGRLLVIDHGYGFETRYGHLQKSLVTEGQKVKRGQKIGLMGNTGRSTSSHLHYEVKLSGRHQNPLNFFYADEVID